MQNADVVDAHATSGVEALSVAEALKQTGSTAAGLSPDEAKRRQLALPKARPEAPAWIAYLSQFRSPIQLLLIFAAVLSGFLGDAADAVTILGIILASSALSFTQERQAGHAVKQLLRLIESKFTVRRGGTTVEVPVNEVVPGDVVEVKAGSFFPGDGKVLESDGLLVDEAALTGESAPVEKQAGDSVFAGTHAQSGSGAMLVVQVGEGTKFGSVAEHLRQVRPESAFHTGIRRYGYMLMEFTVVLTLLVFGVNIYLHKPIVESFLFSVALAVGLTPQMLPAIISVTLAKGARKMAEAKVIVKRLEAIEDFGSMNVLCSDKTGTLTQGTMKVSGAVDRQGNPSDEVVRLAQINAIGVKGFENPIDEALAAAAPSGVVDPGDVLGSLPYDFFRRRQSVLVKDGAGAKLICKGAVEAVLGACQDGDGIREHFERLSNEGLRVLAVSVRQFSEVPTLTTDLEQRMELVGLVAFEDPLREDSAATVEELRRKGVRLKLITGDNRHVACHVARQVGLNADNVVTGDAMGSLTSAALTKQVQKTDVFAEVDPVQKERLILALKKAGYAVGYIGDGINDGPALHAADVGLSVSSAVDVAKEAADFVMLERGLAVIIAGVEEGRRIFANTLKYIFINTSASFGNVLSMAAASVFLPFLPLLPKQILLNNFLTDFPVLTIANDEVDAEILAKPRVWNVKSVRTFMFIFGIHSSVFDLLSFGALIFLLRANETRFHTSWFIESAVSELAILLVIRTRKTFFRSLPGKALLIASAGATLAVCFLPVTRSFGLVPLPPMYALVIAAILVLYVGTAELLKRWYAGGKYPL